MREDSTLGRWRRAPRFEQFETRLVMSADPLGQIVGGELLPEIEQQLQPVTAQIETAAEATAASAPAQIRDTYGFLGAGQTVAVIDSGIAWDHYALGGGFGQGYRVVGGWDFAENDANPYDDGLMGSHGTHVAGIVGGNDALGTGVAPGVDLVALRVFSDDGHGYLDYVEQALRWVHENRDAFANPITTVNLSLGTTWNASTIPSWATLEDEFAQLEADGIFISVAAGNAFASSGMPGLSYPAASSYVVPVSSVDAGGAFSSFSQRHQRAIAAPGRSILSTVPDYVGNQNGQADDYSSYSGTSMAAPYVAGASVLLREAMQFAGYADITQDTLYQVMRDTADSFWDTATGAFYDRLNLQRAIGSVLGGDDYGSAVETAFDLGRIGNDATLAGTLGTLSDHDYFSFTAGFTGTVTLSADGAAFDWASLPEGQWSRDGASFTFDVTADTTYRFGLAASGELSHYTLSLDGVASPGLAATDLGALSLLTLTNENLAGEQWYRLEASRTGILTAEILAAAGESAFCEFYGASRDVPLASGSGRVDVQVAAGDVLYLKLAGGGEFALRLANLVEFAGDTLRVHGTEGDDTFSFSTGREHAITVNGIDYRFDASAFSEVTLHGGGGDDAARVLLTSQNETVVLRPTTMQATRAGLTVRADGMENLDVRSGGGSDTAYFYDSAGDDGFYVRPGRGAMLGAGYQNVVGGFTAIHAFASSGYDQARLLDSAGDDTFVAQGQDARLWGSDFFNEVTHFDAIDSRASRGYDTAYFYDTAGDDNYGVSAKRATMSGDTYANRAARYDRYAGYATAGDDVARLFGNSPIEQVAIDGDTCSLLAPGVCSYIYSFTAVLARSFDDSSLSLVYDASQAEPAAAPTSLATQAITELGGLQMADAAPSTMPATSRSDELVSRPAADAPLLYAALPQMTTEVPTLRTTLYGEPSASPLAEMTGAVEVRSARSATVEAGSLPAIHAALAGLELEIARYSYEQIVADLFNRSPLADLAAVDQLFAESL